MKNILECKELKAESFHYYNSIKEDYIYTIGSEIFISIENKKYHLKVPIKKIYFFLEKFRIFRRLLRLDMMNVMLNHSKNGLLLYL